MSDASIVIVDPYSSGAMLAAELFARGIGCAAVESSLALPTAMRSRFNPAHFAAHIQHNNRCDETLHAVTQLAPTHVIAGFESGVELAEWLAHQLGLPTNDARLAKARRDKFAMGNVVWHAGLRTPRQHKGKTAQELLEWVREHVPWPVVVKPPKGVASDLVFRCDSAPDVLRAAKSVLESRNVLGERNDAVVVQEFLPGVEYAIDAVSYGGRHKVTAVWQYLRVPGQRQSVGYDGMRLLANDEDRVRDVAKFASQVLDAVGIRFGPSHCEVMWTDDGPALVEVAARMSAGNNVLLGRLCGGTCQLDEVVRLLIDPNAFIDQLPCFPAYHSLAVNLFLSVAKRGRLLETRFVDQLEALSTLESLSLANPAGQVVEGTLGRVTLISSSLPQLERDVAIVRRLNDQGIFVVQHDTSANA
ncbi:MAG: ATP-grasp domain-containing protein [Pirellulaceae bacterium]